MRLIDDEDCAVAVADLRQGCNSTKRLVSRPLAEMCFQHDCSGQAVTRAIRLPDCLHFEVRARAVDKNRRTVTGELQWCAGILTWNIGYVAIVGRRHDQHSGSRLPAPPRVPQGSVHIGRAQAVRDAPPSVRHWLHVLRPAACTSCQAALRRDVGARD